MNEPNTKLTLERFTSCQRDGSTIPSKVKQHQRLFTYKSVSTHFLALSRNTDTKCQERTAKKQLQAFPGIYGNDEM